MRRGRTWHVCTAFPRPLTFNKAPIFTKPLEKAEISPLWGSFLLGETGKEGMTVPVGEGFTPPERLPPGGRSRRRRGKEPARIAARTKSDCTHSLKPPSGREGDRLRWKEPARALTRTEPNCTHSPSVSHTLDSSLPEGAISTTLHTKKIHRPAGQRGKNEQVIYSRGIQVIPRPLQNAKSDIVYQAVIPGDPVREASPPPCVSTPVCHRGVRT